MSETVYILKTSFKNFFALSENKTYKRQRWYLTKEYLQPLDFYENECLCKTPEDSKENFLLKLKCGIEAAKLGVKEGVLAGIFLGGFWGLLSEFSDFDYIGFAFGLSERTKDTDDEKMEIELSSQCYTLIKSSEYGKQNSISKESIPVFSDISKNTDITKNIKNDNEKIYPLEKKIQRTIRNSPRSKPRLEGMSKEKNYSNHEGFFDETKIILESLDPGRGHFYNNSSFGFKKGRKNVQIVGCAFIQTGGSLKSQSSDSSSDTANEIFHKKKKKPIFSEVKLFPSDDPSEEKISISQTDLYDDINDDYKSFILRNLPEDFEYEDPVDQGKSHVKDYEIKPLPTFQRQIKENKRLNKSKKNATSIKSESHSSQILNVSQNQKKGIRKKLPYFVKAEHLDNGFDSDQKIAKPVISYQINERVTRPSDSELFLQEIKKLRENLEAEEQSSSEHSSISSPTNSDIHRVKGHRNEFRDNKKSSQFLPRKKDESKVITGYDEETEMKMNSQGELVENEKSSPEPGIVPVPKQRRYTFFYSSESKPEQKSETAPSSQTTETKDPQVELATEAKETTPTPEQKNVFGSFVTSTPHSPAPIQISSPDPTTQNSQSEITPVPAEKKAAISKSQSQKSAIVSEPLDGSTNKSQDTQPLPEQKLFITPTVQNEESKVTPTPSERKSAFPKSQSRKTVTVSEPLDYSINKNQNPQTLPEQRLFITPIVQKEEPKVTPTPTEKKAAVRRSQNRKSEPLDGSTNKNQDPQTLPEQRLFITPTVQNEESKVTPTPSERKSAFSKSQNQKSGTVSEPLDGSINKNQDPQTLPEQRLFITPTVQNEESKVTSTPSERKSAFPKSQSRKSVTVSEPLDGSTNKNQDPQTLPEQRLFITPTVQNEESKVTPTPSERKSAFPKSQSRKTVTVSEPLDYSINKNQNPQPLTEQRLFITSTEEYDEPKITPTPCDRKLVVSLSQTSKSETVATPSVAPISKVTKTEKKELKENHLECVQTNHNDLSTINQNLIFLYACNCAIVLGVICCGLSVFRASFI